jgi:REP element-mobilizing transposase RayT
LQARQSPLAGDVVRIVASVEPSTLGGRASGRSAAVASTKHFNGDPSICYAAHCGGLSREFAVAKQEIPAMTIFTTWTTCGSWLPGDARKWYARRSGLMEPDDREIEIAKQSMTETICILDARQRSIVESAIVDHCRIKDWILHAVNVRSNHVHVALSACDIPLDLPRIQLKSWSTRRLKAESPERTKWWTRRGWDRIIEAPGDLANVVHYINECQ